MLSFVYIFRGCWVARSIFGNWGYAYTTLSSSVHIWSNLFIKLVHILGLGDNQAYLFYLLRTFLFSCLAVEINECF